MADMIQTRMTVEEFLELPEQDGIVELIDGEVYVNTPKEPHAQVVFTLILTLGTTIKTGKFRIAPLSVFLDEYNVVQPDTLWISPDNTHCKVAENGCWHGAPDLVVEVTSPSTAKRDRDEKFSLYERFGVREYCIVDPEALFIEVFALTDGKYARHGIYGEGDTVESPVLNAKFEADKLLKES